MKKTTLSLVRAAVVAAIYATLTLVLYPLSFSIFQVRISECMTLLLLIMPESVLGLSVGCLIANCFSGNVFDLIFGTLATLIAAILSRIVGKTVKNEILKLILGCLPPIIVNAFVVPVTFILAGTASEPYLIGVLSVFVGQAIAVIAVGIPLYFIIKKILLRRNSQGNEKDEL